MLPLKLSLDDSSLVFLINTIGARIMSALDDLNAKVDDLTAKQTDLQAQVAAGNDKADALIAALVDVRAQLAALAANGASPDQLAAVGAKIDAALGSVAATAASVADQVAQDDAALNPAPAP